MAVTVYDDIPQVAAKYAQQAALAITKAALDMEAQVKINIANVPHFEHGQQVGLGAIRTGAMRASVWTKTPASMTARAGAQFGAITGNAGELKAYVGVGVKYAAYVEYGTVRMQARPFFRPAYDETRKALVKYLKKLK